MASAANPAWTLGTLSSPCHASGDESSPFQIPVLLRGGRDPTADLIINPEIDGIVGGGGQWPELHAAQGGVAPVDGRAVLSREIHTGVQSVSAGASISTDVVWLWVRVWVYAAGIIISGPGRLRFVFFFPALFDA